MVLMDKFLKRKFPIEQEQPSTTPISNNLENLQHSSNRSDGVNLQNLPADPGLRPSILEYHPNDRDDIRRAYLQKGPCQPLQHKFPQKKIGNDLRRFNPSWFNEFGNWLEYSISKDAAFCLCCYLMKANLGKQGGDCFITNGYSNWKKKESLVKHVGGPNSAHNEAWAKCQALMKQKQHIDVAISKQSDQAKEDYRIHLTTTIDCIRFLLRQGLAFRGHDESEHSSNQGNFLELIHFASNQNVAFGNVLKRVRGNLKLIAPSIQKDIVSAAANETTQVIVNDLGDDLFAILIDESRDISIKEQMAVVVRYVDEKGHVIERFLGIVHVSSTTALSLKEAIESLFSKHGLSLSRVRGQGYDGASNMQGEFNGLKALIMKENGSAFYIHCFAHQLQLALVSVAKQQTEIALLFTMLNNLANVVGGSCKRRDILREKQVIKIFEGLESGELSSGRGLNQETSLHRAGDTRWSSHYGMLVSLTPMFSSVIDVLDNIVKDATTSEQKGQASALLYFMQSFEFVFDMHLMKNILGVTHELSQALQRKDQDINNAIALVKVAKQRLQRMRDDEWESLLSDVSLFCKKHDIHIPNMDDMFVLCGRSRRNVEKVTNLHHFRVEVFYQVIDKQLQELNNRFTEANTELLTCMACLNPMESFSAFDKRKLIRFAEFYPSEFHPVDLVVLDNQLENYILDVRSDNQFSKLNGIGDLSKMLVETKKNKVYPLVYMLVKLALILPVATATVERAFSAMKIVKNRLRNSMEDEWMNDCLVTYIERDVFDNVATEKIMQHYQNMRNRREQL